MLRKVEVDEHLENTFMPYAMTTIVDRALPDVKDGLKPVHRRILFAMFNRTLTHLKTRAKSSEPVSETMKIHGHGDTSIYDALALMTEQNESLLHPFLDGEGAFGKVYSKDSPSASRYTFCRLNKFAEEMFTDINKNVVDFIEEGGHKQPLALPNTFPNILIKPNSGIAVGLACNFPSFNLIEVCDATIAYIKDKEVNILDYILAPDFSSGGQYILNDTELKNVVDTGRGSIRVRAKYTYNKEDNCIEITEIPYSTTANAIIDKVTQLIKLGKNKDILDIRDETGWDDATEKEKLKIAIEIKKKSDPRFIMEFLFLNSPLEDAFSVNMNCLSNNTPKVMGVKEIIGHWVDFRVDCITRSLEYDLAKYRSEYKLLMGLKAIINDLDSAIAIIRKSKTDAEVIEKLMSTFAIDEAQANYIADIKLRNINKEYIARKTERLKEVKKIGIEISDTLKDTTKINEIIINQLIEVKGKYGKPRLTEIISNEEVKSIPKVDFIEDYNCYIMLSKEGYLKKSMRDSDNHKTKDGDEVLQSLSSTNKSSILLFSNKGNMYTLKSHTIEPVAPSVLGSYIPSLVSLEQDEKIIYMVSTVDFKGGMLFGFENGKIARVDLSSYDSTRQKLQNAYSLISPLVHISLILEDTNFLLKSSIEKTLIINTADIGSKSSRTSQGNQVLKAKNKSTMSYMGSVPTGLGEEAISYYKGRPNSIGTFIKKEHKELL